MTKLREVVTKNAAKRSTDEKAGTFNHEVLHLAGLKHIFDTDIIGSQNDAKQLGPIYNKAEIMNNIMNSGANPIKEFQSTGGKQLTKGQRESVKTTVINEQK